MKREWKTKFEETIKILEKYKSTTVINFSNSTGENYPSDNDRTELFTNFFDKHPEIKVLKLSGNNFVKDDDTIELFKHIKKLPNLTSLDFSSNAVREKGFIEIGDFIAETDRLTTLKMFNLSKTTVKGRTIFCAGLEKNRSLTSVDFSGDENEICSYQLTHALCSCLKSHRTITELKLSSMKPEFGVDPNSLERTFDGLIQCNNQLKILNLSHFDYSIHGIISSLYFNKTLTTLLLDYSMINNRLFEKIMRSLKNNPNFHTLSLKNNEIDDHNLVIEYLNEMKNIRSFHIFSNPFKEESEQIFVDYIEKHNHILDFTFSISPNSPLKERRRHLLMLNIIMDKMKRNFPVHNGWNHMFDLNFKFRDRK
eukprot:gene9193-1279_t